MRYCYMCKSQLEESAFTDSQKRFHGGRPVGRCRSCSSAMNKKWREENKERCAQHRANRRGNEKAKEYDRVRSYKRRYGISAEIYNEMKVAQGYACAICGMSEHEHKLSRWGVLCIDHNHATGAVRALLCAQCNKGLGSFKDSVDLLSKAIEYLSYHEKVKGVARG